MSTSPRIGSAMAESLMAGFGRIATLTEIQRFELNGTSMDGIPMTSGSFNGASTLFAYAFSYDWARGSAGRADPPPRGVGFYCVAVCVLRT